MPDTRTAKSVLESITEAISKKEQWDAYTWLEAAQALIALSSNENDLVGELAQKCAQKKIELMEQGKTAAYANTAIQASDEYRELNKQKALVDRIAETIRIAKYQARLKDTEYRQ